jgi:hypothetical protein
VPFYAYQPDIYFLVAEGPMLLSRVTAHKITNFRCKYLATMATGHDDDDDDNDENDDGDGAAGNGIQRRWRQTTTTTR